MLVLAPASTSESVSTVVTALATLVLVAMVAVAFGVCGGYSLDDVVANSIAVVASVDDCVLSY